MKKMLLMIFGLNPFTAQYAQDVNFYNTLKDPLDDNFGVDEPTMREQKFVENMIPDNAFSPEFDVMNKNAVITDEVVPMDTSQDFYDDPFVNTPNNIFENVFDAASPLNQEYYTTQNQQGVLNAHNSKNMSPEKSQKPLVQKFPAQRNTTTSKNSKSAPVDRLPSGKELYQQVVGDSAKEVFGERDNFFINATNKAFARATGKVLDPSIERVNQVVGGIEQYRKEQEQQFEDNLVNLLRGKQ